MLTRTSCGLAAVMSVLVAATGTTTAATAATDTAAGGDTARERALTSSIRSAMRAGSMPGAIVGVWQRGERPYLRAFGVRDTKTGRRMATNLHMRIGSETKTFTVTALLQLVGEGKVALDDPISKYVPNVVNGDAVTLRQLATMTSGIPSYTQSEAFFRALVSDPMRAFTPQQLLAYVAGEPALFAPGDGFDYSNTNTVLIGLVVEQVSGQALHDYVEQHILEPLGMRATSFPVDAAFPRPHAQGYTEQTLDGTRANATRWNPSWGWAAGAMISTARDLRVWAKHLASGRGLLPPAVQRERLATVSDLGGKPFVYGMGMFNVRGWLGHNGSLPGYQTIAIHRPAGEITVVALINSDIDVGGRANSTRIGRAVTSVVTPRHVYDLPAAPSSR